MNAFYALQQTKTTPLMNFLICVPASECEKPSSPQCFRKDDYDSMYTCEWSSNEKNATFDLYFRNQSKHRGLHETWIEVHEEVLITTTPIEIWVKAHVGNSSCSSDRTFDLNRTNVPLYVLMFFILSCFSALQPPPHASAVGGVTYILTDTQSLHGCPCRKKRQQTNTNNTKYTLSVSYSAANISITARNKAGSSPPTVIQLKPEPGHDVQRRTKCLSVCVKCCNISVSLSKYRLENLSPGSKYNLSLCGVTAVGEGPKATATITTLPEMHTNVWLSLGLLLIFFFISTTCTFILKRIKSRIFPPVPTPVIPDFISSQPECQAMMDRKEEVHELTLFQLHPDSKPVPEDAEESTVLRGGWDNGSDEDQEGESRDRRTSEGDGDECLSSDSTERTLTRSKQTAMADLERVENDIAMLIYKNGLVFDVKADST
uniref:Fibronectin type-III domain-containing protein n=1 Tax=Sphaeramia orbicularis TaxID=375764 RepID=A0A673APY6_9TELE